MLKSNRIIFIALSIVTILSSLGVTSFASNWADTSFTNFCIFSEGYTPIDGRTKEDDSATYVHITSSTNRYVLVFPLGGNNASGSGGWESCLDMDYASFPYVICQRGVQYSIPTNVYERNYTYASLGFLSLYGRDYISGVWSPDSIGSYTIPETT